MSDKGDLVFGLVGCGHIGLLHARMIRKFGTLAAICDPDPGKIASFPDADKVRTYSTIEALLENESGLDVVAICSPNGYHAQHSMQVLQKGLHVICEKPMAIKTADCEAMRAASATYNRKLFIVKQNRFNPPVALLKQWIDTGRLGNIFSVQVNCFWNRNNAYYQNAWRGTKDLDGGTLFTQFSHFIDLLYWMFGDVEQVCAMMDNFNHAQQVMYEDTGVVSLKFSSGVLGSIHFNVNAFRQNMEGSVTVFAEKGTIKVGGRYLNKLEYIQAENIPEAEYLHLLEGEDSGAKRNESHEAVYRALLGAIAEDRDISQSLLDALKTVEIIERIYNSAATAG